MQKLASSHVAGIDYDRNTRILRVVFRNGTNYAYADVPSGVYEAFLRASSPGSFLHSRVRPHYRATKIGNGL